MNVLIADDNHDAAESLAIWLRIEGHEVRVAHDGEGALEAFEAKPAEFVILDISMPGLNGYQVAQRIRRDSKDPSVTLVAVTGWGKDDDKDRALAAGFNHHFTRPIEPDRLAELLHSASLNGAAGHSEVQVARPSPAQGRTAKDPLTPRLLAELCHDLRGPLGAIGTWIRVLQSERAEAATRVRAVTALSADVRALGGLIDQIATLADLLSGPANVSLAPIDVVPFVRSACASAATVGPELGLRADETSLVAIADAVRLRQIVQLFASVALGATDGESAELRLARRGPAAELSIETKGTPGILDVTLARALADAQGGAFEQSLEGGTTLLRLLLPLAR